VETRSRK